MLNNIKIQNRSNLITSENRFAASYNERVFKNVVAQFIGRLCLITQGNYKNLGVKHIRDG